MTSLGIEPGTLRLAAYSPTYVRYRVVRAGMGDRPQTPRPVQRQAAGSGPVGSELE
jgi:hypothetical protein